MDIWWNSANDLVRQDVWVWADSNLPVDPQMWAPGQPSTAGRNCGCFYHNHNKTRLDDAYCRLRAPFICEYDNGN